MSEKLIKNPLLQEIEEENEKAVRTKAKAILKATQVSIQKRHGWIKARQDQIIDYERIQQETYVAYDARDEAKLDKLASECKSKKSSYESGDDE